MKIELDLPEIEGYEYTGEYRAPNACEWFLDGIGKPYQYQTNNFEGRPPFPILKKEAPKYLTVNILEGANWFTVCSDGNFVEIKALEDALKIIKDMDANPELNSNKIPEIKALKALIN